MKRSDAIAIIEREQSKGRFESELDTAIGIALWCMRTSRMTTAQYAAQRCAHGGTTFAVSAARVWMEAADVVEVQKRNEMAYCKCQLGQGQPGHAPNAGCQGLPTE